ncbi:hypothetical protein CP97_00295 [Aurantiacibacter atlanticus]|uniref:Uncharacterized protein n=1 Tax=Aurantiacibacter atlanticus TaxID=1648404 RepID=A0A0H4V898_9SPHN|nr:hypothetical protein CP97_00295 [Aurantiacibacter atlanticus]
MANAAKSTIRTMIAPAFDFVCFAVAIRLVLLERMRAHAAPHTP